MDIANHGLCSIEIAPNGISFARISSTNNAEVEAAGFYPYAFGDKLPDTTQVAKQLASIVQEHKLTGLQCSLVLNPKYYHITLLEAPNVPPVEYKQALKWQIKDLIDYPL